MDKKEMIKEMASDMNFACIELSKEQRLEIARVLINLDYLKISEGSVVLSKEEYQQHRKWLREAEEQNLNRARKETAEKIWKFVAVNGFNEIEKYLKEEFGIKTRTDSV